MQSTTFATRQNEAANVAALSPLTRALLMGGVIAGPLYIALGVLQVLIRPGFNVTRHDLSLMSNGSLGWIQIGNFIITGLLTIGGAAGMWRALPAGRGRRWGPLLLAVYGLGLIGAGFFSADPALGFPPGTPAEAHAISAHGLLHFVSGGLGFLGLIAACLVFARRFASQGRRGWAAYSLATGVLFFLAFFGIASGSNQTGPALTAVVLAFTAAVVLGWAWVSAMAGRLLRRGQTVNLPDRNIIYPSDDPTRRTSMKFHALIQGTGKTAAGIEVPAAVVAALGTSKKPAVRATINGYTYRSSVASMGGKFMLGVSNDVRQKAGVAAGQEVDITLELDTEPRLIAVPDDLARALNKDKAALKTFEALSYSNKRRLIEPIEAAKAPETRQRRIDKTVGLLHDGKS